jgi:hypothetical protein
VKIFPEWYIWVDSRTGLTTNCVLCGKSTDLTWDGDEPSAAVADEVSTAAAEESAPAPQAESEAPAVEAALPEASVIEGGYIARVQVSSSSSRSHQG